MNTLEAKDRTVESQQLKSQDHPTGSRMPSVIASTDLFAGATEILISHAGMHYRLRITRQGKLILNK